MPLVMLVDDSATERAFVSRILISQGFEVVEFDDGEQALARVKAVGPDLIILDVVMPRLNGFQTCRRLKRDEATREIPVIMLTSKDQESDKVWGMRQGAELYLVKPVTEHELLGAVKKFVAT